MVACANTLEYAARVVLGNHLGASASISCSKRGTIYIADIRARGNARDVIGIVDVGGVRIETVAG